MTGHHAPCVNRLWIGELMQLSVNDILAVVIALASANTLLVVAFRRVYVLERRLRRLQGR